MDLGVLYHLFSLFPKTISNTLHKGLLVESGKERDKLEPEKGNWLLINGSSNPFLSWDWLTACFLNGWSFHTAGSFIAQPVAVNPSFSFRTPTFSQGIIGGAAVSCSLAASFPVSYHLLQEYSHLLDASVVNLVAG